MNTLDKAEYTKSIMSHQNTVGVEGRAGDEI